jgi:hypothetical protein
MKKIFILIKSRVINLDKGTKRNIFFWGLIFLIATTSFGLGYMIAKETNIAPIVIEKHSE